jgi:hypothetical protein
VWYFLHAVCDGARLFTFSKMVKKYKPQLCWYGYGPLTRQTPEVTFKRSVMNVVFARSPVVLPYKYVSLRQKRCNGTLLPECDDIRRYISDADPEDVLLEENYAPSALVPGQHRWCFMGLCEHHGKCPTDTFKIATSFSVNVSSVLVSEKMNGQLDVLRPSAQVSMLCDDGKRRVVSEYSQDVFGDFLQYPLVDEYSDARVFDPVCTYTLGENWRLHMFIRCAVTKLDMRIHFDIRKIHQ